MSELGEIFKELKLVSQEKRAHNRERSAEFLRSEGIPFIRKNCGSHLIVTSLDGLIDFWPGTGKFIARSGGKGRGVKNLIKLCVHEEPSEDR